MHTDAVLAILSYQRPPFPLHSFCFYVYDITSIVTDLIYLNLVVSYFCLLKKANIVTSSSEK